MQVSQDVVLTVPPYPYVVGESSDVPLDQCWVDDIQVQLMFYSTLEPMVLPGGGSMEAMGVQKLYEPSPTPILYVGLVADVLGRVPLMPLFLLRNSTPTIPHQLRQHRGARFPHGLADAADESGRKESNVYQPMAVAVWAGAAGQTASGGPVGG